MIHPIAFYTLAALVIGCSVLVVTVRNIFHSGLFLIGSFLGVAAVYVSLHNMFLAAAQLLIYSGAIAVLILFGIMMTQRYWSQTHATHNSLQPLAMALSLGIAGLLGFGFLGFPATPIGPGIGGLIEGIGTALMREYLFPFEIISVVLVAALIGAIALAKDKETAP